MMNDRKKQNTKRKRQKIEKSEKAAKQQQMQLNTKQKYKNIQIVFK